MTACLLTLIALGLPHYSVSNMDADKPRFYVDGVFPSGVYPIPVIDGCIPNTVQLYRDEFGSVTEIALDYAHRKPYDFQMSPRQISFLPPEAARRAEEKHIADQVRAQITRQPEPRQEPVLVAPVKPVDPKPVDPKPAVPAAKPAPKQVTLPTPVPPKKEPVDDWLTVPSKVRGIPLSN